MKVPNTYWQRLQARDRPETMVPTNPSVEPKVRKPTRSGAPVDDARAQVLETLKADEAASKHEERAASATVEAEAMRRSRKKARRLRSLVDRDDGWKPGGQ